MKQLTKEEFAETLRKLIARRYKTQRAAAIKWESTQSYISQVLHCHVQPTQAMLDDAGYERVDSVRYVRKPKGEA